jgi:hypothetical protein
MSELSNCLIPENAVLREDFNLGLMFWESNLAIALVP